MTTAKIKFRFSMFCLSNRPYRGSEVTLGSEDPLHFFFFFERAYLFKRGQVEHILTMANLKLKSSYLRPALVVKVVAEAGESKKSGKTFVFDQIVFLCQICLKVVVKSEFYYVRRNILRFRCDMIELMRRFMSPLLWKY